MWTVTGIIAAFVLFGSGGALLWGGQNVLELADSPDLDPNEDRQALVRLGRIVRGIGWLMLLIATVIVVLLFQHAGQ